ncbi:MAG TPA: low-complexity protein, partial [Cyanobacteria bacterium UBA11691]|nr:low-complexity protein [Cyanobacteria bacterium UBA11691]
MNVNEFLDRYAAGERYFKDVDLFRAELSSASLPGIRLLRADLFAANLFRIN